MHFDILDVRRRLRCGVELVRSETIEIKRRPNQVFTFTDPGNFVDTLIGHESAVVIVGKESKDSEEWKAYYWEPSEGKKDYSTWGGHNMLPLGSLAILEMESEYDLQFELESREEEAKRWTSLFEDVRKLSGKIRDVDRDNRYADYERFQFMTSEELEKTLEEMKEEYKGLTKREKAEI